MADEVAIRKYRKLSVSLYKRTEDGSLSWEQSIVLDGYDAYFGDKVVNIALIETGLEAPDYQISIVDRENYEPVDKFRDIDIHDPSARDVGGFPNYYKLLEALYNMISRRISGADQAIDNILDQLS
jgi:hypothetical protein